MEKRVKRLDLNFDPHENATHDRSYSFCDLSISNSITSRKLASVDVTSEILQSFLKICRSLEYLSVTRSEALVNLEASGASLNLKYLEIYECPEVKHLEICAPNLVTVNYSGPEISSPFKSNPKLAKLFIGGHYSQYLTNNFSELPSCVFQLEELSLELPFGIADGMKSVVQFPICKRFKQLELIVQFPYDDYDLFFFAPLITACPFLHKFVLKLRWEKPDFERECLEVEAFCHDHLKIVEIVGFYGHAMDIEIITYLVKSCVALEKIIIDLCQPLEKGTPWELELDENKLTAAEKLRAEFESRVEFIIKDFI